MDLAAAWRAGERFQNFIEAIAVSTLIFCVQGKNSQLFNRHSTQPTGKSVLNKCSESLGAPASGSVRQRRGAALLFCG